ncbi:hypothetical protein MAIT1_02084 [Magnetofaba australis IT-1]|uniref:DUF218 domain-containing protein n=1 Tax=Magnetofaba australis IT-1 TaxID=1434232 RepID=A0A1Y2K227_9PROT|nr:hypothetical protein MAIT1_02084 [Magnetofaba australis IT-1]
MTVDDEPVSAQWVVLMGGALWQGAGHRLDELLQQGWADNALVLGDPPETFFSVVQSLCAECRIAPEQVVFLPSHNTRSDAQAVRAFFQNRPPRRLLVVTNPYHARRTRLALTQALAAWDVDIRVTHDKTYRNLLPPEQAWWRHSATAAMVLMEYVKIIGLAWPFHDSPSLDAPEQRRARGLGEKVALHMHGVYVSAKNPVS